MYDPQLNALSNKCSAIGHSRGQWEMRTVPKRGNMEQRCTGNCIQNPWKLPVR